MNKRKSFYFIITFCLIFITSCATTLKVNFVRPALLDLNGAKTIAILPFKESNKNVFNYFFDGKDKDFFDYVLYQNQLTKIENDIISYLKSNIENKLLKSPYVSVISSEALKTSLKYGVDCPADVFIDGEIISFKIYDRENKTKNPVQDSKEQEYNIEYTYQRDVELIFNYEIIDGKSKKLIYYDTINIAQSSGEYSNLSDLPSVFSLIKYELDDFINMLLRNIHPFSITKSFTLLKDESKNIQMKNAEELASNGYYKESYENYINVYNSLNLYEAGYNSAIVLIAMGDLVGAESLMEEVYERFGEHTALNALYEIRNEIKQRETLQNQIYKAIDEK